jgi:hypothetical protein
MEVFVKNHFGGGFQVVEEHESYQVIRTPKMVITLDLVQKCNTCGKEMSNCIQDHVRREHPEVEI